MKKYLYIVNGQKFRVSEDRVQAFLSKYPNAQLFGDIDPVEKKKEEITTTPSNDGTQPTSLSKSESQLIAEAKQKANRGVSMAGGVDVAPPPVKQPVNNLADFMEDKPVVINQPATPVTTPVQDDPETISKKIISEDISKNFPVSQSPSLYLPEEVTGVVPQNPFLSAEERNKPYQDKQLSLRDEIINNPEKRAAYSFKRQEEAAEKIKQVQEKLKEKQAQFSSLEYSNNPAIQSAQSTIKDKERLRKEIQPLLAEIKQYNKDIGIHTTIAKTSLEPIITEKLLKSNGIDASTPEGRLAAHAFLASERGRKEVGFEVRRQTDAQFAGQLSDIEESNKNSIFNTLATAGGGSPFAPYSPNGALNDEQRAELTKKAETPLTIDEKFKSLSETGEGKIQANLRIDGHEAIKNYAARAQDPELLAKLQEKDNDVVLENGRARADEIWARVSAQRFKDNGNVTQWSNRDIKNKENLIKWGENAGLNETEMKIYKTLLIPDELSRNTTNIQTSGFLVNTLEGALSVGINAGKFFRSDAARVQETLNENTGTMEEVGQYSPFLQELSQLQEKEKKEGLNAAEKERLSMIKSNTNLLNGWQKLKAGAGTVTGQVAGQAVFATILGGVGGALARGLMGTRAVVGADAIGAAATKVESAGVAAENAAMRTMNFDGAASGIADNMIAAPSTFGRAITKAGQYAKENVNLFASSYVNSYDGYKKEALQLMPGEGNEGMRTLYAGVMATVEGLSEKVFDDRKIFSAFGKEIAPSVTKIVSDISTGQLTSVAAIKKLQSVILGGASFKTYGKKFLLNSNQESSEETIVSLAGDLAKSAILGQNYDVQESLGTAIKTYWTMAVDGALVAGIGARADVRSNTLNKTTMYHMATHAQDYKDEVARLRKNGDITEEQSKEKEIIINTTQNAYQNMIKDKVVDKTGKDDKKNAAYLLHTVNQAINKERANNITDEIPKKEAIAAAERSEKIREGIYTGMINVDEFLNPTTTDKKVSEELDIELTTENSTIESAVIEIGGNTYEGKNHAEAILKARDAGVDISNVDRKADGKFKLSDGTIIDRAQAKQQFGQDQSELIIPQDEAANLANKEYQKIKPKEEAPKQDENAPPVFQPITDIKDPRRKEAINSLTDNEQEEYALLGKDKKLEYLNNKLKEKQPTVTPIESSETLGKAKEPDNSRSQPVMQDAKTEDLSNEVKDKVVGSGVGGDEYLYHGTSEGALSRIINDGLKTGVNREGAVISFADNELYAQSYADRKGGARGVMLRVKKGADFEIDNNVVNDKNGNDYKTSKNISTKDIEVKVGKEWISLDEYDFYEKKRKVVNQSLPTQEQNTPQKNEGTTNKANKPIQENDGQSEGQGNKENVQQGSDGIGQGGAKRAVPILEYIQPNLIKGKDLDNLKGDNLKNYERIKTKFEEIERILTCLTK